MIHKPQIIIYPYNVLYLSNNVFYWIEIVTQIDKICKPLNKYTASMAK